MVWDISYTILKDMMIGYAHSFALFFNDNLHKMRILKKVKRI